MPNTKAKATNEFTINIKKGKKTEKMTFSSDFRSDILTEALRFSHLFCDRFAASKVNNQFYFIFKILINKFFSK